MIKLVIFIVVIIVFFAACVFTTKIAFASTRPLYVEIFTDTAHPVNIFTRDIVTIKYYKLDDLQQLVAQLNTQLKGARSDQAFSLAKQLFAQNTAQIKQAYSILLLAKKYQLNQFPAVVFNHGQAVIYGVIDINQAITNYRLWGQKNE